MNSFKYFLLFFSICILNQSCKKDNQVLFEMDLFFDINIPIGLNTIENHYFIIEDVPTFALNHLAGANLTSEDISRVLGATGNFSTRVSGINLDVIDNMGLHVLDKNDHNIRKEVLYVFNDRIPFGSKTDVDLIPSIIDVKDFFLEETVDLELKVNFRGFASDQIDGRFEFRMSVFPNE